MHGVLCSLTTVACSHTNHITGLDIADRARITGESVIAATALLIVILRLLTAPYGCVRVCVWTRRYLHGFSQRLVAIPVPTCLEGCRAIDANRVLFRELGTLIVATQSSGKPGSFTPVRGWMCEGLGA